MKSEKKLSISVIGPSPRFLSGISYYTIRLVNSLLNNSEEVNALLFRNMLPKRLFPGWKRVGTDLSNLTFEKGAHLSEILDWYNPVSWIRGYFFIRHSDVIIFEWWTSSIAHMYLALQMMIRRRIPCIIEFHEVVDPFEASILPIRLYSRIMGRIIRRNANRYLVHSEHDKALISDNYKINPDLIEVIPHGLYDQYPILPKSEAKEKLGIKTSHVILFFGLIRPYKGVPLLIKAFIQMVKDHPDTTLVIAGEIWEDNETLSLIENFPDKTKILAKNSYISDDEIPFFFSAADMLVLPYLRASQSGVAHIGISYGLPIIASSVGGLNESLGSYDGTVFVNAEDVDELRRALIDKINEPFKKYDAPEHMRWENISKRIVAICNDIICNDIICNDNRREE